MASKKDILNRFHKLNTELNRKVKDAKDGFDVFKTFGTIKELIPTGIYILNAQLTGSLFGGLPNSRSMEICGKSGTGKTFLSLNFARQAQMMGYFIYYIDTEGSLDDEDIMRFGVDIDMMEHIRTIKQYSQLKFFVNELATRKEDTTLDDLKILIIVDSYGMLNTDKEVKDIKKGKSVADMGLRAKEGRAFFRSVTLDLSNCGIPMLFTNHTGANIDLFAIEDEIPSGGGGPTYAASFILMLDKKPLREEIDGAKTKTGIVVKSKTHKNRKAQPHEVYFHISFSKGANPYVYLENFLGWENCGVVRGTILIEKEFMSKYKDGIARNTSKKELITHTWTEGKDKYYCIENKNVSTWAIKDTKMNVPLAKLFTSEVFTRGTLKMMDENIIKPMFMYKSIDELMDEELNDLNCIKPENDKFDLVIDENK